MIDLTQLKFPPPAPITLFKITLGGGHKSIKTINSWPPALRADITLMVACAQQISKRINGLISNKHKVNVRTENSLICSVYPSYIDWQPNTDKWQKFYNPKSPTIAKVQKLFTNGRTPLND